MTFVDPEHFTDVKDSVVGSGRGAADLLGDLERYLRTAADRIVPAGLNLAIASPTSTWPESSNGGTVRSVIGCGSCARSTRRASTWSSV